MPDPVAMVSGGFDPLHVGHLDLLRGAAQHGRVFVALNSDEWLRRKKGYAFMGWTARATILEALSVVARVVTVDDSDGSVCDALERYRPDFFCNGGDRVRGEKGVGAKAEVKLCDKLGIVRLYDVGGPKAERSSRLVGAVVELLR